MPIRGAPLFGLWLEMLAQAGFAEIFVNVHHKGETVRAYIEASPYRDRVILLEEPTLLGTAGTFIRFAESIDDDDVFLAHADNLSLFAMEDFLSAYRGRPTGCGLTMMTFNAPTPESCGIVRVDDQRRVIDFIEKPTAPEGNLANAAVYVAHIPDVVGALQGHGGVTDMSSQVLPLLVGRMNASHNPIYHRDIGTLESLTAAQDEVARLPMFDVLRRRVPSYWASASNDLRLAFRAALDQASVNDEAQIALMA